MSKLRRSRGGFVLKASLALLVVAGIGGVVWFKSRAPETNYTTFKVRRGPLDIKVVEGGEVKAQESQELKSQVKGWEGVKILSIVEEGIYVTEADVKSKKKLVELDSSSINEKLTAALITFKGTQAGLTEAEKAFDIEINQAESDIYAAKLDVTFAQMALAKYLGEEVTTVVMKALEELRIEEEAKAAEKARIEEAERKAREEAAAKAAQEAADKAAQAAAAQAAAEATREATPAAPVAIIADAVPPPAPAEKVEQLDQEAKEISLEDLRIPIPDIDFAAFAKPERLGNGEASQKLSTLQDALMLARADLSKAQNTFDSYKRLADKKFSTPNELENYELSRDRAETAVKAAETAERIFINYEFKKEAQKLMSDFVLATRKLTRTEQQALSKIAQSRAKLLSAKGQFTIEQDRIKDYQDQIAKCVMTAERPGLVVYGGGRERYWNDEPIKEGATVREKQTIITIPDMSKMAVKVNIHESDIKKIVVGQVARIRVDAFPDRILDGEVVKVAVLPDSENRWMNPDLKVYETTIRINGIIEWLKPGMSAQAEVLVKTLDDALYIPIQSVVPQGDKQVCFVIEGGEPKRREIETGDITVEYITVTKGLKAGEKVLIRPPDGSRQEQKKDDGEDGAEPGKKKTEDAPKAAPAPESKPPQQTSTPAPAAVPAAPAA